MQVQAVISAPGELAHRFSKQNLRRKDVYLMGVLWETADFICTNPECRNVLNGYGNYVTNLKREVERLRRVRDAVTTEGENMELISVTQAAKQGVARLRKPIWANKMDHLKIDIIDGTPGPWLHMYCPFNKECNGRDPVDILGIGSDYDAKEFEPYTGPLPDSDEYKAEQAAFDGALRSNAKNQGMPKATGCASNGTTEKEE